MHVLELGHETSKSCAFGPGAGVGSTDHVWPFQDSATGTTFDPVEVEPTAVQATSLVHDTLSRESVLPVPE